MSEKSCNFAAPNANEHIMVSKKINAAIITTRPHGNSLEHRDEFEAAQIADDEIVPFELAQIPCVLFATGWTNHQIILNRCKTDTERLFYMLYAGRERSLLGTKKSPASAFTLTGRKDNKILRFVLPSLL